MEKKEEIMKPIEVKTNNKEDSISRINQKHFKKERIKNIIIEKKIIK